MTETKGRGSVRGIVVIMAAAAVLGLFASSALAAEPTTYTVSGFADGHPGTCGAPSAATEACTTLRAAVQAVNGSYNGPTITLGAGRYVLGGSGGTNEPLELTGGVTIEGDGATQTTIAQTDGTNAVISSSGGPVTIEDLEVTGGKQNGIYNSGSMALRDDLVDGNSDIGPPAAAHSGAEGGDAGGGGIQNAGEMTIAGSTISRNEVVGGTGGSAATPPGSSGGSGGDAVGGGILNELELTITDSTISDNDATAGTGGTAVDGTGGSGNEAEGAGILSDGSQLTLARVTIANNVAGGGDGGDTTGTGTGGEGTVGVGGGLDADSETTVVNSTIVGNSSIGGSAGTSTGGGSKGSYYGGEDGGISAAAKIALYSTTLAYNSAAEHVGNIGTYGSVPVTFKDTLITGGIGVNCGVGNMVTDLGGNLETSGAGVSECGLSAAKGDLLLAAGAAGLAPALAANGGPTETLALLAGSPALGAGGACTDPTSTPAGRPLLVDQRGLPRPAGGPCDIGAFQAQPVTAETAPEVSGLAAVGQTLTCTPGKFGGDGPLTYTYAWLRNGAAIPEADGASYVVQSADAGAGVSCTVAATGPRGSASATSAALAIPSEVAGPGSGTGTTSRSSTPASSTPIVVAPPVEVLAGVPSIPRQSDTVATSGKTTVSVTCTGAGPCTGVLTLSVTERGKAISASIAKTGNHGKPKAHVVKLATATFTVPAGRTAKLGLSLDGAGRALLTVHPKGFAVAATIAHQPAAIVTDITLKPATKPKVKHGGK